MGNSVVGIVARVDFSARKHACDNPLDLRIPSEASSEDNVVDSDLSVFASRRTFWKGYISNWKRWRQSSSKRARYVLRWLKHRS